jgi:hypothetical protein
VVRDTRIKEVIKTKENEDNSVSCTKRDMTAAPESSVRFLWFQTLMQYDCECF